MISDWIELQNSEEEQSRSATTQSPIIENKRDIQPSTRNVQVNPIELRKLIKKNHEKWYNFGNEQITSETST